MKIKNMKLPIIIVVIGMILAVVSCFFTCILEEPVIKEHDFEYSVTYRFDGEEKTFHGVYKCRYDGYLGDESPTVRVYDGTYTQNGEDLGSLSFTVSNKDGVEIYIVTELEAGYLMGESDEEEYGAELQDPFFEAVGADGVALEVPDVFDAEIIDWDYPEPIQNSFEFAGFSILHSTSMIVMLLIGALTLLACVIFVRRDQDVNYQVLDRLSIVFNFVIAFAAIPFVTVVVGMFPLVMDTADLIYQVYLCIPAMTAFAIAASVALRRKGFRKSALVVQLVCPVLFFGYLCVESMIYNLFM